MRGLYLFCLLLVTASASASAAAEWRITKPVASSEYVFCRDDCPARTAKMIDLEEPAPAPLAEKAMAKLQLPVLVLQFALGSERLTPSNRARVNEWARLASSEMPIRVSGSTDKVGARGFNRRLAIRRAESVARALGAAGVARSRISLDAQCCVGYPPSYNPAARRAVVQQGDGQT